MTRPPPRTEHEIAVCRWWIASVRRGETPDTERDLIIAEVLERWLDGETYEEILENWRRPKGLPANPAD